MKNTLLKARTAHLANKILSGLVMALLAYLLLGSIFADSSVNAAGINPVIDPDFQIIWKRADEPVLEGKADRSWTWGPAITPLLNEVYREGGNRKVQYFDKARMELTQGRQVSNGLLAKEMITGLLQLGDNDFKQTEPNTSINIAGDQGNQQNPTYASFRKVATIASERGENFTSDNTGKVVTAIISRDGKTGNNPDLARYNIKEMVFEKTLHHNIPDVFWKFETLNGPIYVNGQYTTGKVVDWLESFGLPLTEAYWTRTVVRGQMQDVLVQAFERRVLTYTPSNEANFKVEMGNVGQHYREWRNNLPAGSDSLTPVSTPPAGNWWQPTSEKPIHWHWQLSEDFVYPRDVLPNVTVYDIDGEHTSSDTVAKLHALGKDIKVICYFDAGVFETYRSDAGRFPREVIGKKDAGWEGSYWLDIRRTDILLPIMQDRMQHWCKDKGFDAIEPDETEVWSNDSGFTITREQNNLYNQKIAEMAHALNLSVGLKGNTSEAPELWQYFDWSLNEQCWHFRECDKLKTSFLAHGKAVLNIEYDGAPDCATANSWHLNSALRDLDLVGPTNPAYLFVPCIPNSINNW
ncbi:MAG TPA: endo alpha-1,4 polygalactosaminidase [Chloroflexia bacterium]|nr:endo alpha-1,4 polygalactosaminidase [Chloroflexia bacterium]